LPFTGLKKLAGDKHFGLCRPAISDEEKSFLILTSELRGVEFEHLAQEMTESQLQVLDHRAEQNQF
jgi:hypothetical protein